MRILFIFASELEAKSITYNNTRHSSEILISGVGTFASIYSTTKKIETYKPDLLIHGGICGSFSSDLPIGTVVQVIEDCFADVGVFENNSFHSVFDMQFANPNKFPFTQGKLALPSEYVFDFLPQVSGITVNTITNSEFQKKIFTDKYMSQIETMEGAAIHYVSLLEQIPCIHIRAISNMVGERDKTNWNIPVALQQLNNAIQKILQSV